MNSKIKLLKKKKKKKKKKKNSSKRKNLHPFLLAVKFFFCFFSLCTIEKFTYLQSKFKKYFQL